MGLIHDKFKFQLEGHQWRVDMRSRMKGYRYIVTINGQRIVDEPREQNGKQMLAENHIALTYHGKDYLIKLAPAHWWTYGLHIYRDDVCIYRHKDRDFKAMPRLEKWVASLDKIESKYDKTEPKDKRPMWKQLSEGLIIGAFIGTIGSIGINALEDRGILSGELDGKWIVIPLAILVVATLPERLRLIR